LAAKARKKINTRNNGNAVSMEDFLEGTINHNNTTFGVGRNVFKKVVS
jgi:hypothetical protein